MENCGGVDVSDYVLYVEEVENLAAEVIAGRCVIGSEHASLDGAPSRELGRLVALSARRKAGAFFTTSKLRDGVFKKALPATPKFLSALDPSCGAGDLLIRWSDRLQLGRSLDETLVQWGGLLSGVDTQPEFIRLARARLVLAAAARHQEAGVCQPLDRYFTGFVIGDGLERLRNEPFPAWVLQNPSFASFSAPEWFPHGKGKVSMAAAFVSAWLQKARPGQQSVAILPDVLRTGSRYRSWRESIERTSQITKLSILGQFAADVDIDVFLLSLKAQTQSQTQPTWWQPVPEELPSLRSKPKVSVGTVVPHRDLETGPVHSFLTANNLPHRRVVDAPSTTRAYTGKLFHPPFVAVRRTSRPGQSPRALATIVRGSEPVAVENHLIVIEPRKGGFSECERIAAKLEDPASTKWLDQRLGVRHLTTVALSDLLGG